ncbi:early nodulin-like protein 1 [Olea europaea var. sylvestris]|uniref:early nodulin-like protein 1 n=1 Tax=Olea europaea var. sylvestris TaxID=158386 RepID=UPI000C1CEA2D|nr:early nodulin-like protein 1 [Olea europaea var. sylvestris]
MDCTPSPKIFQEMPENQPTSLSRPGRIPDMAVPFFVDEFNKWAEKTRFQFGDSLVLKYDSKTESMLKVTEEDYKICNNANQIKSHHDGETTISLEKSCLFFFISGAEEHFYNGQKLEVMVLSDKHGSSHQSTVQKLPRNA